MLIKEFLKNNHIVLDGGMGTLLQSAGLQPGELPERWNLSHPDIIISLQKSYYDAGSNIVNTNTFGANSLKFDDAELESIVAAAIQCARTAGQQSLSTQPKFVALDIGPTGRMLEPYGDLGMEEAIRIFGKTVRLGVKYGVDLIMIETMNDSLETKAALLAAKENSNLPVFVSNAYGSDNKLMTGASPSAMIAMLEGMGADAIGINCSLGPQALLPVIQEYLEKASVPVLFKPNAGLPRVENGKTLYDVTVEQFAATVLESVRQGVRIVGGCCGTTPFHIQAITQALPQIPCIPILPKNETIVSSYTHAVTIGNKPVLIGERINPTGKKRLKQALVEQDMTFILEEGVRQQELGADILDVNVGLPTIDEVQMLQQVVRELQAVTDLPLQLDTSNPKAMEAAMRIYNGKPLVNSVNGKQESMDAIFPLVQKYGGTVIALTLDENGIPETVDGRIEIAQRIIKEADTYGISKKNIVFDPLAMTISTSGTSANITLETIKRIRNELGCYTSLGVSNISFGLPKRDIITSTFFAMALQNGLNAAIMNPGSPDMQRVYHAYLALSGQDENCLNYITYAGSLPDDVTIVNSAPQGNTSQPLDGKSELHKAIVRGMKKQAGDVCRQLCQNTDPMQLVNNEIIPALNEVGKGFEAKSIFLPQLLMSAEAASAAFEQVKAASVNTVNSSSPKFPIVIATVRGDIHDIGKNIVKLLLENYGFPVTDLGKDVPPESIVDAVIRLHAPLACLSALMTTTVPAMEETIQMIHEKAPWCKTCVGGAVLTQEYADQIQADKYSPEAMVTVRYAEELSQQLS